MSADMLITVCNAPVYPASEGKTYPEIITDHAVLITRATDDVLDSLTTLVRSREDGDASLFESALTEDQLDLFEDDHDQDADIVERRRELGLMVIKDVINTVFPAVGGFGEGNPELSSEVTWIWVGPVEERTTFLVTGGMSWGDSPTDAMPALSLLDALGLFDEPFVRPGEEPPAPPRTLTSEELIEFNDFLTDRLAALGWNAESDDDYDALNDLTHELAPLQVQVDELLAKFLADNARG